jgi:hypothetical protein
MRGREAHRGVLHDGKVTMFSQDDGSYVAVAGFQTFATLSGPGISNDAEELGRTRSRRQSHVSLAIDREGLDSADSRSKRRVPPEPGLSR